MIERAAMAIAIARGKRWTEISDTERVLYREDAKAVLKALRDPSSAMITAGSDSLDWDWENGGLVGGATEALHNCFVSMIDAALADKGAQS